MGTQQEQTKQKQTQKEDKQEINNDNNKNKTQQNKHTNSFLEKSQSIRVTNEAKVFLHHIRFLFTHFHIFNC